jgi:hypothetical protein
MASGGSSICFAYSFAFPKAANGTYDFNNGLIPIESGGPALKTLGEPGQYIKEKIPG